MENNLTCTKCLQLEMYPLKPLCTLHLALGTYNNKVTLEVCKSNFKSFIYPPPNFITSSAVFVQIYVINNCDFLT